MSGSMRGRGRELLLAAVVGLAVLSPPAAAVGSGDTIEFSIVPGPLGYGATPGVSDVPSLKLRGKGEVGTARMGDFVVSDASGSGQGWSITVSGDDGPGRSPVLAQYCPRFWCGTERGPDYVPGGRSFPPNSLSYDSSGSRFVGEAGSVGAKPTHGCDSGCFVDAAPDSPTRIASAARGTGMGTFRTQGASKVRLAAADTAQRLPGRQVYRVDLSWTLNSGP